MRPSDGGAREAWRAKYAREPRPWSGPVHAAPLLAGLTGRVVELGASGGKVRSALPPGTLGLDWAREALDPPGIVGDVRALPFKDGSLDGIVAIHVLGHLAAADRPFAVEAWRRALRPGGALVLEVFARGDAREGSGREVEPATWEREGIATHLFDEAELAGLMEKWEGAAALEERRARWGVRRVLRGRFVRSSTARPYRPSPR